MRVLAFATAILSMAQASLVAKLTALEGSNANGQFNVEFSLSNPTEQVLDIHSYLTPFNGFWKDILDVTDQDGNPMLYTGKMARFQVTNDTLLSVQAGDTLAIRTDLSKVYALEEDGVFAAAWKFGSSEAKAIVSGTRGDRTEYPTSDGATGFGNPVPVNCNAADTNRITTTHSGSVGEVSRARNCLSSGCSAVVTWYGTGSIPQRLHTDWQNIQSAFGSTYRPNCRPAGCGNNVYGYVYPSDTQRNIYVCNLFFDRPSEQVNTMVHEMSHFSNVAATQDTAYGQSACLALARSNPTAARRNADNFCYFSEAA